MKFEEMVSLPIGSKVKYLKGKPTVTYVKTGPGSVSIGGSCCAFRRLYNGLPGGEYKWFYAEEIEQEEER